MRARSMLVGLMLLLSSLPAQAEQGVPSESELGPIGGLSETAEETVADAAAQAVAIAGLQPAAVGPRIAIVSSGVDVSVLPESLRAQITLLGNGGDPLGYGTYAASALLQLVPDARIISIGIYPGGRWNPWWQVGALDWLQQNTAAVDAVLYAFPPGEFLDPVQASMVTGEWRFMAEALSNRSVQASKGPLFGVPLWGNWRNWLLRGVGANERAAYERFAYLVGFWNHARVRIQQLTNAGVPVVAPAGDLGPGPQTILGVSNLPEVITVGGASYGAVSSASSSGPAIDGTVKPDLIAPTGVVGLLPAASSLARALKPKGLLDASLQPAWDAGEPLTQARARLDSSITSAAVVAAAAGALAAEGVRNPARIRAALTAASVPIQGVPVWRQGAGLLRTIPDRAFAESRPLVLSHASLGVEPATGAWSRDLTIEGGTATGGTATMTDTIGVGPDGKNVISSVAAGEGPPVSVSVTDEGVRVAAPAGDHTYQGGLYCGYNEVSIPTTGGSVSPSVTVEGIPVGTEQVPTCLVEGTRLNAHGFYIHDQVAEDLTFALLPAIPVAGSILHQALHILPMDPLTTPIFSRVTDTEGWARFPNVPPGYYAIRQFSDYGSPVTQTVQSSSNGLPVVQTGDIGANPAYQSFEALVLSAACSTDVSTALGEDPCTKDYLVQKFGADKVEFEPATWGYLVGPKELGEARPRVVMGRVKKMPGANVTSRYIDLFEYRDLQFLTTQASDVLKPVELPSTSGATGDLRLWDFQPGLQDPESLVAKYAPAGSTAVGYGIARYPFRMTTPNYKAHMSLNFGYEVTNAYIVVVVQVGFEWHLGIITPQGTFQLPAVGPRTPVNLGSFQIFGHADGKANFEFQMLPRGISEGNVWFVFIPPNNTSVSTASIGSMSFELDTWTNALWPATDFDGDGANDGHAFSFSPNLTPAQISNPPKCRAVDNGTHKAQVCEDWTVLLHSPKDDAATVDLTDHASGTSITSAMAAAGAAYFDPKRGTSDFTHFLSWSAPNLAEIEARLTVENWFKTNGRFWEQLKVPLGAIRQYPGRMNVKILDNLPGSAHPLFPHALGPAPVAPYVAYRNTSAFLDP